MSKPAVYIQAHHVCSPLGEGSAAVLDRILCGESGLHETVLPGWPGKPVCAALFSASQWKGMQQEDAFTHFESLLLKSIRGCLGLHPLDLSDPRTLLVLASTKGNIELLQAGDEGAEEKVSLAASAEKIAKALHYHGTPLLVSNACISGMSALLVAKRLIQSGQYHQALVAGADTLSPFIVAGFQSFQALSAEPCRPFDRDRNGINLGEGAAAVILSKTPAAIRLSGGATSSDANHISGPSRTGGEMAKAISRALEEASVGPGEIGFINAHGTATPFNDEMESKAFAQSGLAAAPVFSLKPYFGHTLGAAGLLETAVSLQAMERNLVLGARGYSNHGVSQELNIPKETYPLYNMRHLLKTGSGFGGCNAALVFTKTS